MFRVSGFTVKFLEFRDLGFRVLGFTVWSSVFQKNVSG